MASPKPPNLGPALDSATSAASAATSAISSAIPSGADIGEFIREQRQHAKLSLRRLAEDTGVSNPYLSQIERGLRKPSAEILQQLAKGLRISAEQLYVQAGLLEDRGTSQAVEAALVSDAAITERQKRVLLDIYASFVTENQALAHAGVATDGDAPAKRSRRTRKSTAKKSTAKKSSTTNRTATKRPSKKTASKKTAGTKSAATKQTSTTTKKRTSRSAGRPTSKSTTARTKKRSSS